MAHHLMWTRSGVVWAMWRLNGLSNGYGTKNMKSLIRAHHQAFFQAIRGEALLLGFCAELDPVTVVERMLADVKIEDCPAWAEEVELTLDALEQVPLGERAFWLAVPLAAGSFKNRALSAVRAADTQLRGMLALPHQLPNENEVETALMVAAEIEKNIPAPFKPSRATAAEHVWISLHAQHRGLAIDAMAPVPAAQQQLEGFNTPALELADFQLPAAMPNPWLDEGGQSDFPAKLQRIGAFKRRYVKVQSPHSEQPSYQVLHALVGAPKIGWAIPGHEWISHVEQFDIDIDWAIRLTVTAAADVRRRNKNAENAIKDQGGQLSADASITGAGSDLAEIAEVLSAYVDSLNRSDKEVEVQGTIIFAVGGDSPELAMAKGRFLAVAYKQDDFMLEAPLGGQEELWWAMVPGVPTTHLVRELAQITTGREFASGLPLVSTVLGDQKGSRFGVNITTGRRVPILHDVAGNIQADTSGSFGVVAELGAGKSVLLKAEAGDTVDRGGRIVAIDRTESQEYATFARTLDPDHTAIAGLLDPTYSLDPLRVFGPRVGARMVQSLFAVMLGLPVLSDGGVVLSRLLEPDYLAEHGITSLRALTTHLKRDISQTSQTDQLLGLMNVIASKDLGEVLFNDGLPALDTAATGIVFLTHGLALPDRSELESEHLFRELSLEKRFGRAMYTMLTAVTRETCFMDTSQLAGAFFDECHAITSSPEGERELGIFFRDGRKHGAYAAVGSHDPADFGDHRTRGLIKTRFVMRQTDTELAERALEWLSKGLSEDKAMVRLVTEDLSPVDASGTVPAHRRGEGVMRDVAGNIGKFQKTLPERAERRKAILSTPSKAAA